MRINKKNKINVKKFIGIIMAFIIVITSIISPNISIIANAVEAKSTIDENGIINIPLKWSKNNMNAVNSYTSVNNNRYRISTNYFNMLSSKNEFPKHLLSPKDAEAMKYSRRYGWYPIGENAIGEAGNILRTPMLIDPTSNRKDLYTIDYRYLEKWFEPPNSNGSEPISLYQTKDVWNEDPGKSASWRQTSNSEYTSQDWYMFRGIVDENAFKDNGITDKNIGDYEFYLAMPDGKMILGANDLVSVFVDEHSTEINYATPSLNKYGNRRINFKARSKENSNSFVTQTITYNNLSTDRYDGNTNDSKIHGYQGLNLGSSDGWHVDLNNLDKDGKGNVVLGNVTDIINQNVYGDNRHMIDMLASEWCGNGGMTSLALYAVKKPQLSVKKVAYIKSQDKDKIKEADKLEPDSKGDVILNTDNNIPSIPADVPVYFKFELTNTGQTTVDNIQFKDEMLNNITYDNKNLNKASIVDSSGKSTNLSKLMPGQSITLKDENHLKYLSDSNSYPDLNKEITNTVEASGTYFGNQLTVKDSNSVKFKTYFEPNISVKKTLVNINGKDVVDYDNDKQPLVAGDKVKFNIEVTNNSDIPIGGLSLKDTLKNDGEDDVTKWTFDSKEDINANNFILKAGQTIKFSTIWTVTNTRESKGSNIAYIDINGCKEKFPSNEVDFSIKDKKGTINVTKNIENYSSLNDSDKNNVDNQLFTLSLIDNTVNNNNDDKVQTVAIKNGQTAQFEGVKYGHRYTIKESIPMNYKLVSILNNKTNSDTFTMESDKDNSTVTVTNSYSDKGWFEWYENVANKLKTASNL